MLLLIINISASITMSSVYCLNKTQGPRPLDIIVELKNNFLHFSNQNICFGCLVCLHALHTSQAVLCSWQQLDIGTAYSIFTVFLKDKCY